MNMETCTIREHMASFTLVDIDGTRINVPISDIDRITRFLPYSDVDPEQIALVFGTIEKIRIDSSPTFEKKKLSRINKDVLCRGICNLLLDYSPAILCDILEELKYHEIEKVINSCNPRAVMQTMI